MDRAIRPEKGKGEEESMKTEQTFMRAVIERYGENWDAWPVPKDRGPDQ